MPQHKSCVKRVRTSEIRRLKNRALRSNLRSAIKSLRQESDKDEALKAYCKVTSMLDRAASARLIHRKNAARHKSRFARMVNGLA